MGQFSPSLTLDSKDCLTTLLGYIYLARENDKQSVSQLKEYARYLNKSPLDIGRNWLFIYEVLSKSELKGYWRQMKDNGVTFLKGN